MKKIIDIHTHIFPADIAHNWEKYAERDSYFRQLTYPKYGHIQRYATAEEALELAKQAGVDKIVMQGWYWNDLGLCKHHNDYMYEIICKYPDQFEAFTCINPNFGDLAIAELERNYKRGFAGVGEMGPGGNNFTLTDTRFLSIMEAADYYHLPVNIHVSGPLDRDYPGKDHTPIASFYNLAKTFPELTLILAHLGGGLPFYELKPEVRMTFKNVYYDLAANPLLYMTQSIKHVANMVGADKILFGSDFPLLTHPRKSKEKGFKIFIDDIRENADLSGEEWDKIMGMNAEKILSSARRKI